MKIYLIEPVREKFRMVPTFSVGLMYIASYLEKQGYTPYLSWVTSEEELNYHLELFNPDVVGITCGTPLVGATLEIARNIKEKNGTLPVIAGGIHPTVRPLDLLESGDVDYCCIGEGEMTMAEFCSAIEEKKDLLSVKGLACLKNDKLIFTEKRQVIENLDELPWPAYHLVPNYQWMLENRKTRGVWVNRAEMIFTSRGCPNQCIFCESHRIHGYKLRRRTAEDVVSEMEYLINTYGVDHFTITDDTFTYPFPKVRLADGAIISWLDRWCDLVEESGLKFTFMCQARANTIDERIVQRLKKIGLKQLSFGFESGSDNVLKILKKGITVEQIRHTMAIVNKHNIKSHASFLFGVPGQTQDDIDKTENLLDEISLKYVDFFIITPFPGTQLEKIAEEKEWLDQKMKWDDYEITDTVVLKSEYFSAKEILEIKRRFQNKYVKKNILESFSSVSAVFWALGVVVRNLYILPKSIGRLFMTGGFHEFFMSFIVNDRKKSYQKYLNRLRASKGQKV